eukprot:g1203.t1
MSMSWRGAFSISCLVIAASTAATADTSCQVFSDTDFNGHDLHAAHASDPGTCCSVCRNTTGCLFWTHMGDTTVCYLKTSDAGRRPSPKSGAQTYTSGCSTNPCPPTPPTPAPPPHGKGFGCDPFGGERGVCVNGYGDFPDAMCGGGCAKSSAGFKCASDWDCSLAGECDIKSGACKCDGWASGSDCSYLAFEPVDRAALGYVDAQHSSWGGNAVLGSDKKWHLFMAEIACASASGTRCGLGGWGSHSQVAHAVSDAPAGPYQRVELVAAPEHHNPTLKVSPVDGAWHLYSISGGGGPIVVSTSRDEGKTWDSTKPGVQVSKEQNPGPFLWKNGSMTMWYRAGGRTSSPCSNELIGVHYCANATAPCEPAEPSGSVYTHTSEDPSVFVDHRGNYHMLVNALPGGCNPKVQQGGHAWSRDGVAWSEPRVGAYNGTVQFTDGSSMTCGRRERPQMIQDPETGRPLAMSAGATGCPSFNTSAGVLFKGGQDCFTLFQMMRS